jgi:SPP1 family predicted phage head-tail adaptor
MINAGELRHKITIQSQTDATTAYGTKRTWSDFLSNRPTKILPSAVGRDVYRTAEGNIESIKFLIRYSTGVTPDMRIVHGGQNYRITHVENVRGMHVELLITAETART